MSLIKAIQLDKEVEIYDFIRSSNNINILLDNHQRTPLIYSSIYGKTKIVRQLIDAGAQINYQDRWGQTALMYAASKNYPEVVNILIKAGAKLEIHSKESLTALQYGLIWNNTEVVRSLIEAGADINVKNNRGENVFTLAMLRGENTEIIKILLSCKVDINQRDCSGFGTLPIETAATFNYFDTVCILLESGAKINNKNSTILNETIDSGNYNIFKILIEAGGNINNIEPSSNGTTALIT